MYNKTWCNLDAVAALVLSRLPPEKTKTDHGIDHILQVEKNAAFLCRKTPSANLTTVRLFAWLHDAERVSEYDDQMHGLRAAALAERLRGELFDMPDEEFKKLHSAILFHAHGFTSDDPTIGVCWDADRLDLSRVGITPDKTLMSTSAGKSGQCTL